MLAHFGGPVKLAEALGIKHQAISQWDGKIPLLRAYQIEGLTNGRYKVPRPARPHQKPAKARK